MIFPTILENEFEEVVNKIKLVETFTNFAQLDIADGIVTDGKTFTEIYKIETLAGSVRLELDLMLNTPVGFIYKKYANVDAICYYIGSSQVDQDLIEQTKSLGYKVGVSIALDMAIEKLKNYIDIVDYVQFFTVVPGKQGNPFREDVLEHLVNFKKLYPHMRIQVDGSINDSTIDLVKTTGVLDMAVGSAIFNSTNPKETFINLQERLMK